LSRLTFTESLLSVHLRKHLNLPQLNALIEETGGHIGLQNNAQAHNQATLFW
jgi:hypothetical protein